MPTRANFVTVVNLICPGNVGRVSSRISHHRISRLVVELLRIRVLNWTTPRHSWQPEKTPCGNKVFRELLQNADDAHATAAEIRFDTKQHLAQQEQGAQYQVDQWTFRNNGTPFRNEDWNRLKKIGKYLQVDFENDWTYILLVAEGNPDEQKIGAFGVGEFQSQLILIISLTTSQPRILQSFLGNGRTLCEERYRMDGILLAQRRRPVVRQTRRPPCRIHQLGMDLVRNAPARVGALARSTCGHCAIFGDQFDFYDSFAKRVDVF
ncbi:hypothetical protein AG1IA_09475 [Rhizoctonia solani AG-1 IA]|uniref:Sacsin/Nov domain-containing protein n=1 Tax=Thanatephorus cucumeris (strain AG1-IA) TaxID=983506 RepID=L8WEV3_THACA|nr:hypothetical protein AG1IA_09475 [Rhizoctonia solani AG-1 IA]